MALKIGLLGAGSISYPHLAAHKNNPNVGEVIVADVNEKARNVLCEKYQVIRSVERYQDLLNDPSIDLIDVCLPSYLHAKVSIEALQAGKHVLCEKPLAISMDEADQMIQTADKTKKRLFGVLNQRFMPIHEKAKELLNKGEIGQPMFMISQIFGNELSRFGDPKHWKGDLKMAGGGVLIDSGIHHIDLMQFFLGEIASVSAVFKKMIVKAENKGEDNAFLTMEFKNGPVGTLMTSYTMTELPWTEPKAIYGTEGTLVIDDSQPIPLKVVKCAERNVHPDGCTRCDKTKDIIIAPDSGIGENPWFFSIRRCIDNFIDALLTNSEPIVTCFDGRKSLGVALAAEESSKTGKRINL